MTSGPAVGADGLLARVAALEQAANLADGRVDDAAVAEATRVVAQVGKRLSLSGERTVVALAGATGSGKSSTFNALSGTTLAEAGITRPTTSAVLAASFGPAPDQELLDWLDVPRRHRVSGAPAELDGLLLLDLPDHDSTEHAHREQVDNMVKVVDLLVWVVDPQKYADAVLHDAYLRPFAHHADSMVVVLNQVDRLTPEQEEACLADLRRLLDSEGLRATQVLPISATEGIGVDVLHALIVDQVRSKQAVVRRLSADVDAAVARLQKAVGEGPVMSIPPERIDQLVDALGAAAGADTVIDAVFKATRLRGRQATGWPMLSWLNRLRPDPLRRLHLDRPATDRHTLDAPVRVQRTALPGRVGGVQQARVDQAVRDLAHEAGQDLPRGFSDAVRRAAHSHDDVLTDRLDKAVATTDLGMETRPMSWVPLRALQWALLACLGVGVVWWLVAGVFNALLIAEVPLARIHGAMPMPTLFIIIGIGGAIIVSVISHGMVDLAARARATKALEGLLVSVRQVAVECVVDPVTEELQRAATAREALRRAE